MGKEFTPKVGRKSWIKSIVVKGKADSLIPTEGEFGIGKFGRTESASGIVGCCGSLKWNSEYVGLHLSVAILIMKNRNSVSTRHHILKRKKDRLFGY
jgi:hypothetical protein